MAIVGESVLDAAAVIGDSFDGELLAEVVGTSRLDALDALAGEQGASIVVVSPTGGLFPDPSQRQQHYGAIVPSSRERIHQRIAETLTSWYEQGRPVEPAEIARHLLATGPQNRHRAAELLLQAGRLASERREHSNAERHYMAAVDVAVSTPGGHAVAASCFLALGRDRLASTDLESARAAYESAARHARLAERADLLAEAALGVGSGTTGFEVGLVDRTQIDLLEECLGKLPAEETRLRAAVLARLSVALTMVDAPGRRERVAEEAVSLARAGQDPALLGVALSALCDAIAGPEDTNRRRELADDIVASARSTHDPELELLGRRHRLVAVAEAGDFASVDAGIRDFGALADVVGQSLYGWYVPLWRAMRALMEGRIDDASGLIDEAAATGRSAGSHNAYLLAMTARWCLKSEIADRESIAAMASELGAANEHGVWVTVALALMAAETGKAGEARARLDSASPRLPEVGRDSEWVPMMTQIAEIVGHLGEHPIAPWVYEALSPFQDQFTIEGIGAATRGSVHRPLGVVAAAVGDRVRAERHFAEAIDRHRSVGAPLLVARTLRDWGVALDLPDRLAEALENYERLGIVGRVDEVRALLDPSPARELQERRFVPDGDSWLLAFGGQQVRVRNSKGLRDIAVLLEHPGRPVPALDLASATEGRSRGRRTSEHDLHPEGGLGEMLDDKARSAYRHRLDELAVEIDEAEGLGDGERATAARVERDMLVDQLSSAIGLGGRPRTAGDPAERARTTVTARIRNAIGRIEQVHPDLGRHLRISVRTGTVCVYEPDSAGPWVLP